MPVLIFMKETLEQCFKSFWTIMKVYGGGGSVFGLTNKTLVLVLVCPGFDENKENIEYQQTFFYCTSHVQYYSLLVFNGTIWNSQTRINGFWV